MNRCHKDYCPCPQIAEMLIGNRTYVCKYPKTRHKKLGVQRKAGLFLIDRPQGERGKHDLEQREGSETA